MVAPVVDLRNVSFAYGDGRRALRELGLQVAEGEHLAIVGPNGSGKSTLGRILAGLEALSGATEARVCGHDLGDAQSRRLVRRSAGILFQDPEGQVVGATVEEDVAFGLENLGLPAADIARRVDEMLRRFHLEELRTREPHRLSGGQKQRTALAGVMAIPRRLLVLDEPTAMLDAQGAGEVRTAVAELRGDGLTALSVTQEMDDVPPADRVVALQSGEAVFSGPPGELFADEALLSRLSLGAPIATEVALELRRRGHRLPGLPMDLDDLTEALSAVMDPGRPAVGSPAEGGAVAAGHESGAVAGGSAVIGGHDGAAAGDDGAAVGELLGDGPGMTVACRDLRFAYDRSTDAVPAVDVPALELQPGTATALLGPSGSGKSTLLLLLRGLLEPGAGGVSLDGKDGPATGYTELQRHVGLVFQRAEAQLFAATAFDDVAFGPRQFGRSPADVAAAAEAAMAAVGLPSEEYRDRHPYSLSGGEQRRLALAGVLAMRPRALLLDEPTVSLDPGGRRELLAVLHRLKRSGVTLLLATHDVDLAWSLCERRVVLDGGRPIADDEWCAGGAGPLRDAGLAEPVLVGLWRRLGLTAAAGTVGIPRTAAAAAEALARGLTASPASPGVT